MSVRVKDPQWRFRHPDRSVFDVESAFTLCALLETCILLGRKMVDLVGIEPTTSSMPWKRIVRLYTLPYPSEHLHRISTIY
jgi:hypothetical protein